MVVVRSPIVPQHALTQPDDLSPLYCTLALRLVYGAAPKGLKQPFVPELRLLGCVEVDRVFALPLQKDTDLVAVPLNAKIKLQRAKNMEQLDNFMEFSRFLEKAKRLMMDARDRLQVVDLKYSEKETKKSERGLGLFHSHTSHHLLSSSSGSNATKNSKFITSSPQMTTNQLIASLENGFVLRKSASCDSTSKYMQSQSHHSSLGSIADEYDEIDQIYDYVRGFAPLPKSVSTRSMGLVSESIPEQTTMSNVTSSHHHHSHLNHSNTNTNSKSSQISKSHIDNYNSGNYSSVLNTVANHSNNNSLEKRMAANNNHHHHHGHHFHYSHHQNGSGEAEKPIPPPIETIPSKKVPEKRQRPTLPKLYVKNVINHKATPVIIPTNGKDLLEPQSPLFHIRWVVR